METLIAEKQHNNSFLKTNAIFAYLFASLPAITMFFALVAPNAQMTIGMFYVFWLFAYLIAFCFFLPSHAKWIKNTFTNSKLIKAIISIAVLCFGLVILSCCVIGTFNVATITMLSYFLLAVCFLCLNKKQIKIFFHILFACIAFCLILNLCDPSGIIFPYFSHFWYYSSIFATTNYPAYVVAMLVVVLANFMLVNKNKKLLALYCFYFVLFSVFMFFNASFAPITAVFFALGVEFIALWIKDKKFPWQILLILLSFAAISLLLELIPNLHAVSGAEQNYFVELTAVFDNIFHTHLLQDIFHIEAVAGSDGWERGSLLKNSIWAALGGNETTIGGKIKTILFGVGSDSTTALRPHNLAVSLWIEHGPIFASLMISLIVLLLVFMTKGTKANVKHVRPFFYAAIAYLFGTVFGSLKVYHFIYFVVILAIGVKISMIAREEQKQTTEQ